VSPPISPKNLPGRSLDDGDERSRAREVLRPDSVPLADAALEDMDQSSGRLGEMRVDQLLRPVGLAENHAILAGGLADDVMVNTRPGLSKRL